MIFPQVDCILSAAQFCHANIPTPTPKYNPHWNLRKSLFKYKHDLAKPLSCVFLKGPGHVHYHEKNIFRLHKISREVHYTGTYPYGSTLGWNLTLPNYNPSSVKLFWDTWWKCLYSYDHNISRASLLPKTHSAESCGSLVEESPTERFQKGVSPVSRVILQAREWDGMDLLYKGKLNGSGQLESSTNWNKAKLILKIQDCT